MHVPHGIKLPAVKPPRVLAAGIGALLDAADVAAELGPDAARALLARPQALARRAERRYHGAVERGDLAISQATAAASRRLGQTADGAAAWADRTIVRRLTRSMTPYLIDEFVPTVIEGVMPKIRSDVVPVVIEDLADDERVRTMVAQQSQDMLAWSVSEVRRACAAGDDRVESAIHRVIGRRDAGA